MPDVPQPPPHPPIIRAITEPCPTWAVFTDCGNIFEGKPPKEPLPPIFRRVITSTAMEVVINGYPHTAIWMWVSGRIVPTPDKLKDKLLQFFLLDRREGSLQVSSNCVNFCGFTTSDPADHNEPTRNSWRDICDEQRKKLEGLIADAHKQKIMVPSKQIVGPQGELLH